MTLTDRSRAEVFEAPAGEVSRHAFSEQRIQVAARVRASALVRVRRETRPPSNAAVLHLGGVLTLRGPQARIRFRHGAGGENDDSLEPDVVDTPLLPPGTTLPLVEPSRLACRALTPGTLAWISFVDADDSPLASPICIDTSGRGPLHIEPLFEFPATVTAWLIARRLSRQGPIMDLAGELRFPDGIVMRVALAADCNRFGNPSPASETFDVEVAARGGSIAVPRRRVSTLVRGKPLVSIEVRDWDGRRHGLERSVGWLTPL